MSPIQLPLFFLPRACSSARCLPPPHPHVRVCLPPPLPNPHVRALLPPPPPPHPPLCARACRRRRCIRPCLRAPAAAVTAAAPSLAVPPHGPTAACRGVQTHSRVA